MPTSFAHTVEDWQSLLAAIPEHPELAALIEVEKTDLEKALEEVQVLKKRQDSHQAVKQQITQQLKATLAQGRDLAVHIRTLAKGKIGLKNERLVQFRVAPVRRRSRRSKTEGPEAKQSPASPAAPATGTKP